MGITIRKNVFIASSIDGRWRHVKILHCALPHGIYNADLDGDFVRIELTMFGWRVV